MKSFVLVVLLSLFVGHFALACLPTLGTHTQDIVLDGKVVGKFINTIPAGYQGGTIEVTMNDSNASVALEIVSDVRSASVSGIGRAVINGMYLAGGETLLIRIGNRRTRFFIDRTRDVSGSTPCGLASQK